MTKITYEQIYEQLNDQQREAVDTIFGPVLVIAGPGTGKTQLLSARVAHILKQTDTSPNNILCLTFTDNGAENMRQRLASFIDPQAAYEVEISTYHAFGNSLLSQGRDFLDNERESIDDYQQFQIVKQLKESLSNSNLLYPSKNKVKDILGAIQDIKQENISPSMFKQIAEHNLAQIKQAKPKLQILNNLNSLGRSAKDTSEKINIFESLYNELKAIDGPRIHINTPTFIEKICDTFEEQKLKYDSAPKKSIKFLTNHWKDKFFDKDLNNNFKFKDEFASKKALDLADFYEKYENELANQELQDFNDMILRAIKLLEENPDFKFSMQEKYQFILLDEYQDTNGAQSEIIKLLTTNNLIPDYEPNVLAVGDDDQAIMAFQGAKSSNMQDFVNYYGPKTKIINLVKNYRSHQKILDFAQNIAEQIDSRLSNIVPDLTKTINQANNKIDKVNILRKKYKHQSTEFYDVAEKIQALIKAGTQPRNIAVLAPKHAILEDFTKYLHYFNLPVTYEKSENILEANTTSQLLDMLKLAQAIANNSPEQNYLWGKVISFDFWQLGAIDIYNYLNQYDKWNQNSPSLTKIILSSENVNFKQIGEFFVNIASKLEQDKFETVVDYLVGSKQIDGVIKSPLKDYYKNKSDEDFYNLSVYLTILRDKFVSNSSSEQGLNVTNFLKMIDLYLESETKITSKNAFSSSTNSVNVMTAFSAKGLEFEHTFLISVDDSSWGVSTGNVQSISMPKNMERIKDPNQEDTKKRLFFVAITRAKTNLYLTSSEQSFDGIVRQPLKILAEDIENEKSTMFPAEFSSIETEDTSKPTEEILDLNWNGIFDPAKLKFEQIFIDKAQKFRHSASSLTNYYDLKYGGPEKFFYNNILKFPQESSSSAQFGTLMHDIFDFWQKNINSGKNISLDEIIDQANKKIARMRLTDIQTENEKTKAQLAFKNFYNHRRHIFNAKAKSEVKISTAVLNNNILIGGKIDRIEINDDEKTIEIVDFKTGHIAEKNTFKNSPKLHHNKIQLYFYKILLNNSSEYKHYKVNRARLEYIEGSEENKIPATREIVFDQSEEDRIKLMLSALDHKIKCFDFEPVKTKTNIAVKDLIAFEDSTIENYKQNMLQYQNESRNL